MRALAGAAEAGARRQAATVAYVLGLLLTSPSSIARLTTLLLRALALALARAVGWMAGRASERGLLSRPRLLGAPFRAAARARLRRVHVFAAVLLFVRALAAARRAALDAVSGVRAARRRLAELRDEAGDYRLWAAASLALASLRPGGLAASARLTADLFDAPLLRARAAALRKARAAGDGRELAFELRGDLSRDLGNQTDRGLQTPWSPVPASIRAHADEARAGVRALAQAADVPPAEKAAFLREVRHAHGRTALVLSGGGSFGVFHVGVIKELLHAGLLPRVLAGSSAGSITAAVAATRTERELAEFLEEMQRVDPEPFFSSNTFGAILKHLMRTGSLQDAGVLRRRLRRLLGDLTFADAYARTGRVLCVAVTAADTLEPARLLNHLTAPHVLVWSAVGCSSAFPFLFAPQTLIARDHQGRLVEWSGLGGTGRPATEADPWLREELGEDAGPVGGGGKAAVGGAHGTAAVEGAAPAGGSPAERRDGKGGGAAGRGLYGRPDELSSSRASMPTTLPSPPPAAEAAEAGAAAMGSQVDPCDADNMGGSGGADAGAGGDARAGDTSCLRGRDSWGGAAWQGLCRLSGLHRARGRGEARKAGSEPGTAGTSSGGASGDASASPAARAPLRTEPPAPSASASGTAVGVGAEAGAASLPARRRWRDGSLELDLPMNGLSELFNVNYFFVSQCNPYLLPIIALKRAVPPVLGELAEAEFKHRCSQLAELLPLRFERGAIGRLLRLVNQPWEGDCTVVLPAGTLHAGKALINLDRRAAELAWRAGRIAVWERLGLFEATCAVELELDACIHGLREDARLARKARAHPAAALALASRPALSIRTPPPSMATALPHHHHQQQQQQQPRHAFRGASPRDGQRQPPSARGAPQHVADARQSWARSRVGVASASGTAVGGRAATATADALRASPPPPLPQVPSPQQGYYQHQLQYHHHQPHRPALASGAAGASGRRTTFAADTVDKGVEGDGNAARTPFSPAAGAEPGASSSRAPAPSRAGTRIPQMPAERSTSSAEERAWGDAESEEDGNAEAAPGGARRAQSVAEARPHERGRLEAARAPARHATAGAVAGSPSGSASPALGGASPDASLRHLAGLTSETPAQPDEWQEEAEPDSTLPSRLGSVASAGRLSSFVLPRSVEPSQTAAAPHRTPDGGAKPEAAGAGRAGGCDDAADGGASPRAASGEGGAADLAGSERSGRAPSEPTLRGPFSLPEGSEGSPRVRAPARSPRGSAEDALPGSPELESIATFALASSSACPSRLNSFGVPVPFSRPESFVSGTGEWRVSRAPSLATATSRHRTRSFSRESEAGEQLAASTSEGALLSATLEPDATLEDAEALDEMLAEQAQRALGDDEADVVGSSGGAIYGWGGSAVARGDAFASPRHFGGEWAVAPPNEGPRARGAGRAAGVGEARVAPRHRDTGAFARDAGFGDPELQVGPRASSSCAVATWERTRRASLGSSLFDHAEEGRQGALGHRRGTARGGGLGRRELGSSDLGSGRDSNPSPEMRSVPRSLERNLSTAAGPPQPWATHAPAGADTRGRALAANASSSSGFLPASPLAPSASPLPPASPRASAAFGLPPASPYAPSFAAPSSARARLRRRPALASTVRLSPEAFDEDPAEGHWAFGDPPAADFDRGAAAWSDFFATLGAQGSFGSPDEGRAGRSGGGAFKAATGTALPGPRDPRPSGSGLGARLRRKASNSPGLASLAQGLRSLGSRALLRRGDSQDRGSG